MLVGVDRDWPSAMTDVWFFRLQIAQLSSASCGPCQPDPSATALTSKTSNAAQNFLLRMIR
jgi:hypothetical protein